MNGVYDDNWGDDIPWIGLESLQDYSRSLLDIYNQIIDDILNGTYDSSEDIPCTYSEAWEQAISDAWQDVVEQSTGSVPGESESDKPTEGEGKDESTDGEDTNSEEPPEGEEHRFTEEEIQEILNDIKGDGFKNNPLRQAYEDEVRALKDLGEELLAGGKSLEEVARTLWQARRDLGIKYKDMTPELLREYIYEINLNRYDDKLGPSFEYYINELEKSFEEIIDSASRPTMILINYLRDLKSC